MAAGRRVLVAVWIVAAFVGNACACAKEGDSDTDGLWSAAAAGAQARGQAPVPEAAATAPRSRELFHYGLPGPTYPFHLFPKLAILQERWTVMRDEAVAITHDMNLLRTATCFDGDVADDFVRKVIEGGNNGWTTAWTQDRGWKNYGLVQRNEAIPGVTETLCPETVRMLKAIPGMRLAGFSKLLPNAKIETHVDNAGLSHNSLAVHVYLTGYARMRLDNLWVEHIPGNVLVFDGNINHEVMNGPEERIILYLELDLQDFFMGSEGIDLSPSRPQIL